MGYPTKRVRRQMHVRAMTLIATAGLSGMNIKRHESVSRRWKGGSHVIYSMEVDGVTIYRASKASLARIWLELME